MSEETNTAVEVTTEEVVATPAQFKTVVDAIEKMSVLELHELVKLNYYNEATHHGLLALPGYFRDLLR